MNKIKSLFFSLLLSGICLSQQSPQYRQVALSPSLNNPSAMCLQKQSSISFSGRWQMLGFGNEPKTLVLNGQTQIKRKPKIVFNPGSRIQREFTPLEKKKKIILQHFVGGQILSDNYGAFKYIESNFSYAVNLPITSKWKASIGMRMGIRNNSFLPNQGEVLNVQDVQLPYQGGDLTYDDYISKNYQSIAFSSTAGITISSRNMFVSIAGFHGGLPNGLVSQTSYFDPQIHWNAMMGYTIKVANGLDIQPMLLLKKMQPTPLSIEFNTLATINYIFWAGINYQYKSSAGVLVGMEVSDNLKIGYAIDFSTNRINKFSNGGHEIYLSYGF